jgi:hypothetical protein
LENLKSMPRWDKLKRTTCLLEDKDETHPKDNFYYISGTFVLPVNFKID